MDLILQNRILVINRNHILRENDKDIIGVQVNSGVNNSNIVLGKVDAISVINIREIEISVNDINLEILIIFGIDHFRVEMKDEVRVLIFRKVRVDSQNVSVL